MSALAQETIGTAATGAGCGAPDQSAPLPASVDLDRETVITGVVNVDGRVVGGAYVRLLDASGEFTAEVVTSPEGVFRFFAAPGTWTLRALARDGEGSTEVVATTGQNNVTVTLGE